MYIILIFLNQKKIFSSNFFFLTPYHGLQVIADCKVFSGFHTHNTDGDIYAVCIILFILYYAKKHL